MTPAEYLREHDAANRRADRLETLAIIGIVLVALVLIVIAGFWIQRNKVEGCEVDLAKALRVETRYAEGYCLIRQPDGGWSPTGAR